MNKNNDIQQKAIDEYVGEWRDHHPSILKIREKEEEYKMLKDQYDDAYKTYIKAMRKGSGLNYTLKDGQNVPGVQELINKNKVRYVRVNHNYQYLHINEMEVFDENGNNVAENAIKKKVYVSVTVGTGRWDATRKWAWIGFRDGNKDVTKRYWLWGRNFRRGSDINFEIPVNFSNNGIDGMSFYIGNDGTRIKRIRVWIYNEETNRWDQIVDKNKGKWYKNKWDQVKFKRISFQRDTNKPEAYASSEGWSGEANKIIDGEHSNRSWWPDANSNHTLNREKEYIEVDLKQEHTVKKIRIWNRPDCCRWRLWNAEMVLLNEARQQVGEKIKLAANRVRDYPIRIDNQPKEGRLARSFKRWIGIKECNSLCAEDEDCEIALYRPQTWTKDNGWSWGNQCIHYDKTVKETENMPMPEYQYTAYNKPVWETKNDLNYGKGQLTRNDDNDDFKFLGKKDSLAACKNTSIESEDGPYDSVIYYSKDVKEKEWQKGCYGSVMGSSKNKQKMEGVYTAIPPGGQTGVITEEYRHSLEDVIYLNKKLKKLADEIISLHEKLYKAGEQYDSKLKNLNFSMENKKLKELQNLEKDRKNLLKMKKDINSLNSEQDNYDFILTTNQYQYIALTIVALALLGLTIHQINKMKKE